MIPAYYYMDMHHLSGEKIEHAVMNAVVLEEVCKMNINDN